MNDDEDLMVEVVVRVERSGRVEVRMNSHSDCAPGARTLLAVGAMEDARRMLLDASVGRYEPAKA
jgi:hypothetical protein